MTHVSDGSLTAGRGIRSDRHGVIECDPALAFSGKYADPGDRAAHGLVAQHDPQVSASRHGGAEVQGSRAAEQAGSVRGEAVWVVEDRSGKSRKQKRTAKQMHADLVALGYGGSYGRVAVFVRAWKAERQRDAQTSGRGTFVPLIFAPGEAFQFDWSEDWAMLGGERTKLQAAHIKLSHPPDAVRRADPGVPGVRRGSAARDLRQHEDRSRSLRGG